MEEVGVYAAVLVMGIRCVSCGVVRERVSRRGEEQARRVNREGGGGGKEERGKGKRKGKEQRVRGRGKRKEEHTLRIVFNAFVLTFTSTSLSSASLLNVLFCRLGSQNLFITPSAPSHSIPSKPHHTIPFHPNNRQPPHFHTSGRKEERNRTSVSSSSKTARYSHKSSSSHETDHSATS